MKIKLQEEKFTTREKEILGYMKTLDLNEGNIKLTASKVGLSRPTLMKYRELYWDMYLSTKQMVYNDTNLDIEKKNIEQAVRISVVEGKLTNMLDLMIRRLEFIFEDPELAKKVNAKTIFYGLSVILPYLSEKKEGNNGEEDTGEHKHNSVVERVMGAMKRAKEAGLISETNIQNNINIQNINHAESKDQL